MVVYENSLLTISFFPETDTLTVVWADVQPYSGPEIRQTLQKLIDAIKNYNVTNLLMDDTQANIGISDDEYRQIVFEFLKELAKTNVRKFARIRTSDPLREEKANAIQKDKSLPFVFESFNNKEEAFGWLSALL